MIYITGNTHGEGHILDFINLPEEKREQVTTHAIWQPIPEQKLRWGIHLVRKPLD